MEKIYSQYKSDKSLEEVIEKTPCLDGLKPEVFRSDRIDSLWDLEGFKPLAWTPNVKYLFYNDTTGILVSDIEGDLYIWNDPTDDLIEEKVQEYPEAEVSLGEKYDSRFKRGEN